MHVDWSNPDRLLVTLFLAATVHALVIFGLGFETPKPEKLKKSLDVVLVRQPSPRAPEKADFLAQEQQMGSGEAEEKLAPMEQPALPPGLGQIPDHPKPKPVPALKNKPKAILHQAKSEKKVVADRGKEEEQPEEAHLPRLDAETLSRQIAEFSAEYNKSSQTQARRPKVVYINSVNANKYKAAAYESAWREKVERVGNLNYPDEARRHKLSGSLVLAVGVKANGEIYSMRVTTTSGEPALDDAAKRIVQMAAPFAPFPEDLKQEADVLVITRTWRFSNENHMQTGR